jgi:hypothetical protein
MKKLLLSILATVGIAVILPVSAFADGGTSTIAGTVTSNGSPVVGANVSVACDGHTLTSGTTLGGGYIVTFSSSDCPAGAIATVTANKGGGTDSKTGKVDNLSKSPTVINLAIINVSVPELGALTAAGAAVLGGAAFMMIRRKHLNQN